MNPVVDLLREVLEGVLDVEAGLGGRLDEAVAGLQRVVKDDPSEIDAAYNLGVLLEVQQRPVEAMRLYERLLKLHPYHAPTWQRLGDVQVRLGAGQLDEIELANPQASLAASPPVSVRGTVGARSSRS